MTEAQCKLLKEFAIKTIHDNWDNSKSLSEMEFFIEEAESLMLLDLRNNLWLETKKIANEDNELQQQYVAATGYPF